MKPVGVQNATASHYVEQMQRDEYATCSRSFALDIRTRMRQKELLQPGEGILHGAARRRSSRPRKRHVLFQLCHFVAVTTSIPSVRLYSHWRTELL